MMMLKVVKLRTSRNHEVSRNYLLLSCAYASNIGGTGVTTGSPPNLVVLSTLNKEYGEGNAPLSYASWMGFSAPLMMLNCLIAWIWILLLQKFQSKGGMPASKDQDIKVKKIIMEKKEALGKMSMHPCTVAIIDHVVHCIQKLSSYTLKKLF